MAGLKSEFFPRRLVTLRSRGRMRQGGRVLCHDETVRGARLAMTDRSGGVSPAPYDALDLALHTGDDAACVQENRKRLAAVLGLSPRNLVFGQQVHGTGVRLVTASADVDADTGLPETDGLVTRTRGLGLVIMGADCLPVLVAADGVVGAAHVGRAGLAAGILRELVSVMRAAGAGAMSARIGPGICGRCYEVPAAMADEVDALAPGSRSTTRSGSSGVDLAAGARRQLRDELIEDVADVGGCTLEQPDRFFSYRRDRVTGRHAGVIVLP